MVILLTALTNLSFLKAKRLGSIQALTTKLTGGSHHRSVRLSLISSKTPPPRKVNHACVKLGAAKNTKLLRTMALIRLASLDSRSTLTLREDLLASTKMWRYKPTIMKYTKTRNKRIHSLTYTLDILFEFLTIKHIWPFFGRILCPAIVLKPPMKRQRSRKAQDLRQ